MNSMFPVICKRAGALTDGLPQDIPVDSTVFMSLSSPRIDLPVRHLAIMLTPRCHRVRDN